MAWFWPILQPNTLHSESHQKLARP